MSKSLGNSPDPLDLISKYGADGLRHGIMSIAPKGQDIRFSEERIEQGRNFCNKLWNVSRFRLMSSNLSDNSLIELILARIQKEAVNEDDQAILLRLVETLNQVENLYKEYEFNAVLQTIYRFFWNDFCDWYIEVSKLRIQNAETKETCLASRIFAYGKSFYYYIRLLLSSLKSYGLFWVLLVEIRFKELPREQELNCWKN